ncbi:MAG: hypothetical protein D6756_13145 [Cyanobacteria bacterium J083]|nr:MAG: hypothetical protein D6756_13145 [Cyanobacteria bacterium J083]
MESSGPSHDTAQSPGPRWAKILGTFIAVLTLTVPFIIIAHYSTGARIESLPTRIYRLPNIN